jgi:hypothetical protein
MSINYKSENIELEKQNKSLKNKIKYIQNKEKVETFFYTHIKWISIIFSLFLVLLMDKIGDYTHNTNVLYQDIRNIIGAVLVGIFFSFLLSLKSIRIFLLKSVSSFMSDDSYIDRLDLKEIKRIKGKIANRLHGTDIVSNNESLYNYLEKLDDFHSIPHKSIVDEKWIFEEIDNSDELFKLTRIQDFRVHKLKNIDGTTFDIIIKNYTDSKENLLERVKESLKIVIKIDSDKEYTVKDGDPELSIKFNKDSNEIRIDFYKKITLHKEYTSIHIEIEQIENIDFSQAIYSTNAAYHLDYSINLPPTYEITNIYHSNTLDLGNEQVNIKQTNSNNLSVNINGWQLPGLIFVYTFAKKIV